MLCPVPAPNPRGTAWVSVPLQDRGAPDAGLLRDWVEESYRTVAPRRLAVRLDARGA